MSMLENGSGSKVPKSIAQGAADKVEIKEKILSVNVDQR